MASQPQYDMNLDTRFAPLELIDLASLVNAKNCGTTRHSAG